MSTLDCQQLKNQLSDKFDLVCFVDLAELHGEHGKVFDLFRQLYKQEYNNAERLVLYSSEKPDQAFVDHIQCAATRVDISNFFILFVCPDDLSELLELARHNHSHDSVRMQNMIMPLSDTRPYGSPGFASRDFLCPLPFMAATINVSDIGLVTPCCKYKGSCGSLKNQSLQEIFNAQEYQQIRQQMINGKQPPGCINCVAVEKVGSTSLRQMIMDKYQDILNQSCLDHPSIVDLTIKPSSLCNFKCRICDAHSSTSIRHEEIHFAPTVEEKNKIKLAFPITDFPEQDAIFVDSDLSPEYLHILGGEPFLWPKLLSTIDQLISTNRSKNLVLEFNTNGSVYPAYLESIVDYFKMIEILISVDAVGPRFELQRGGTWATVLENLKKFSKLNDHPTVSVKLAPVVNIQNLLYLDDVIELANDLGFELVWQYLEDPAYLCIDNVTSAVKQKVRELYQNHPIPELRRIAYRMTQTVAVSGQPFLEFIEKIDQRRDQNFFEFHQEICKLMKIQV
jgi:MoaA/NifB/PqqE/SkfB family radical SAM enzyme